jgi:hypothetical protein
VDHVSTFKVAVEQMYNWSPTLVIKGHLLDLLEHIDALRFCFTVFVRAPSAVGGLILRENAVHDRPERNITE